MGVGLDAGLELDGLAEKLAVLMDKADDAALVGDGNKLADALVKLAGHLLVNRPFVPDKKNALPQDWKDVLSLGLQVLTRDPLAQKKWELSKTLLPTALFGRLKPCEHAASR